MKDKKKSKPLSLRTGLPAMMVACCAISIVIVMIVYAVLLSVSEERSSRSRFDAEADGMMRQIELRLSDAIESSKAVSYDGVVKSAYRDYLDSGDSAVLYKTCTEYLNQNFSRDERVGSVYISFRDPSIGLCPYILSSYSKSYLTLREYLDTVQDELFSFLGTSTTGIFFRAYNGNLYMVRNLLDAKFESFAALAVQLNTEVLFQALIGMSGDSDASFSLDGCGYVLHPDGSVGNADEKETDDESVLSYSGEADGHAIVCSARFTNTGLQNIPELGIATVTAVLLVVPLILIMVLIYRKHISVPSAALVDATAKVRDGERGYVIEDTAPNEEFGRLYLHFNDMSTELKVQFERLYLEQQSLQRAKIKALQSQINPHFLNNTLEVISWEARLAENDKVSTMIEALSTMLGASLDRDNRSIVTLREELEYVDAYLYIIRERLGGRLTEKIDVSDSLREIMVPRLVLQPIVENAVEHDITPKRSGWVRISAEQDDDILLLNVEHEGSLSDEDEAAIAMLLSGTELPGISRGSVGLRNVSERIRLIYGGRASLEIRQSGENVILARLSLPLGSEMHGRTAGIAQ